jgi:peptidoglycan/xylan/chitin deacetylase (PgdA/CDA1 family)
MCLYRLGYSHVRNLLLRLKGQPVTRILTFHDIPAGDEGNFRKMLYTAKRYSNVLSLDDYFSGKCASDRVNTVLTFDDGYKSWVTEAAPTLRNLGLPATFFISSGLLGEDKPNNAEFLNSRLQLTGDTVGLTKQDVRDLAGQGFTIGGHTSNHSNLSQMFDDAQITLEIAQDKQELERIIGREIRYFAYPYGGCRNERVNLSGLVEGAGYMGAVTTVAGFNTSVTDPY